jgi:hypothetical protein
MKLRFAYQPLTPARVHVSEWNPEADLGELTNSRGGDETATSIAE